MTNKQRRKLNRLFYRAQKAHSRMAKAREALAKGFVFNNKEWDKS